MAVIRYPQDTLEAALRKHHGLVALAADEVGMSREWLFGRIQRSPHLQAVLAECRERTTDVAESSLFRQLAAGEAWAVCFYLKTQGRNRGYIERQEIDITQTIRRAALATGLDPDEAERAAEAILALN